MEQYIGDSAECDWWAQRLPPHGRLRFESSQHLFCVIHREAKLPSKVLIRQGVPFFWG